MGAWSHNPFGNDTACDWAYGLDERRDFSLITEAIQAVLDNGSDYLDSDLASEAVAAAEILAKALGRSTQTDSNSEEVDAWIKSITAKPSQDLLSKTNGALVRFMGPDSELRELWEESEDFGSWESSIKALQSALGF
ncbi:DUF4259 domain-containing protein [Halopseudomonas maritima]|uniref:DUF4259 domain-containing protein n=1 Tax=Halopseudomonas maritima TaxID=2918528 RepID=UPI001EEB3D68|nr:DUF4259 domain-containing protein [Halopseudomonas maritima]UJJ30514.1 DUF4259 domain-containing protein [Halopseudomonas maritima]